MDYPRYHNYNRSQDYEYYDDNPWADNDDKRKIDRRYTHAEDSEPPRAARQGGRRSETMTSWIQRQANSHGVQLAGAAVLSGVAVAGAILGYQSVKRQAAVEELKASIPAWDESSVEKVVTPPISEEDRRSALLAKRAQQGDYDDDLILEQLARNRVFLNDEGLEKLRSSFIIVVGCGGVGSHAAAALARSGVGRIRLIDFDQVTLSSLNRHALATLADVGTPKVHCIEKRLQQVTPWVRFDCRNQLYSEAAADQLLNPWSMANDTVTRKPDYVLDCIDNISSKVSLLHYCHSRGIKVISSMGAGCKSDPTRVAIGDISLSLEDPLSRSTRRRLKMLGVSSGIPVVFSLEKPGPGKAELLPLAEEEISKGDVSDLGVLPDFRVRILPVLGTMPAVFGYTIANHVICEVSGYPNEYNPAGKSRDKFYDSILGALQGTEARLAKTIEGQDPVGLRIPISKEDVGYLIEEVWRSKSVVSGLTTRLVLIRWERPVHGFGADPELLKQGQKGVRLQLSELVCMTKEEALHHETEVLKGGKKHSEVYDDTIIQKVRERMEEERFFQRYRSLRKSTGRHEADRVCINQGSMTGKRYLLVLLVLICLSFAAWRSLGYSTVETVKDKELDRALDEGNRDRIGGWFGSNALPGFSDMAHIQTLDARLLPGEKKAWFRRSKRRLIIVGDVHGCKDELEKLLARVSFNREKGDHLIFTGDLISKGPESVEVVRLARKYSASCVRGNHEDKVLLTRREISGSSRSTGSSAKRETKAHVLARQLSDDDATWLESCPVILKVGYIRGMGDVVVVHGGLVPGVPLERQDPSSVMTMRTLDVDSHTPSSLKEGTGWSKVFDEYQHRMVKEKNERPTTVIYGHDAKQLPVIRLYTKGLDTSCVRGGKLTALIIGDGGRQRLKQVKCKGYV
ncbi:uncharacterized protein ARB_06641 [Trichophyton benhamiae CBS 112371]|uniref:THIF-type NAD/FAD binding fold domain-containing protein n=1 Tax=Arthroderma benhamiae (strain ATCC MYA-4681 / CBS 112371) TaxID=663331 RepID=D4ARA1_ARTBC|nr:uncharacterized protein ARB_06641 [Trichophyton benhamiae CBS 112371]EFE34244.1 hypothetical protein ARB_06641 [Trichophyton benhamiae CBS 112371]